VCARVRVKECVRSAHMCVCVSVRKGVKKDITEGSVSVGERVREEE